ncbi:MAG: 2-amino-4-hydroxy-6-hydroxymethyldihydropteridine diphosphokinase [Kiritimatiellia bacterium]
MEAGLSLGSNIGGRLKALAMAKEAIVRIPGVRLKAQSPVYETEPVDVPPEFRDRKYLNAVLVINWNNNPSELARVLRETETSLGRERTGERNSPRTIDIDIIYAGDSQVDEPGLKIPHPRWNTRRFVVQPLSDVRPGMRVGNEPRAVSEILASLPDTPGVTVYSGNW